MSSKFTHLLSITHASITYACNQKKIVINSARVSRGIVRDILKSARKVMTVIASPTLPFLRHVGASLYDLCVIILKCLCRLMNDYLILQDLIHTI